MCPFYRAYYGDNKEVYNLASLAFEMPSCNESGDSYLFHKHDEFCYWSIYVSSVISFLDYPVKGNMC